MPALLSALLGGLGRLGGGLLGLGGTAVRTAGALVPAAGRALASPFGGTLAGFGLGSVLFGGGGGGAPGGDGAMVGLSPLGRIAGPLVTAIRVALAGGSDREVRDILRSVPSRMQVAWDLALGGPISQEIVPAVPLDPAMAPFILMRISAALRSARRPRRRAVPASFSRFLAQLKMFRRISGVVQARAVSRKGR